MDKQKGISALIIVILVALAVGGYLVYQKYLNSVSVPQPTSQPVSTPAAIVFTNESTSSAETANWKTYTNQIQQFLIKYPDNKKVEIRETDTTKNDCHGKSAVVDILIYPSGYVKSQEEIDFSGELWVNISVVENEDLSSPENFMAKNCPQIDESKIGSKKAIRIDTVPSLEIVYKNVMAEQLEVIVQKDKKLYFIHGFSRKLPSSIFDQILSTFKFTN